MLPHFQKVLGLYEKMVNTVKTSLAAFVSNVAVLAVCTGTMREMYQGFLYAICKLCLAAVCLHEN